MYVLCSILLVSFCIFGTVSADFSWNWTQITDEKTLEKIHGAGKVAYVYEDIIYNTFLWNRITLISNTSTLDGNFSGFTQYYTVWTNPNGAQNPVFALGHTLYLGSGSYITSGFIQEKPGMKTQVQLLENNYIVTSTGLTVPKQDTRARKYYIVDFNYDITQPECDTLEYFRDSEWKIPYTYTGGWINEDTYFSVGCRDPESDCRCDDSERQGCFIKQSKVYSSPKLLAHKSYPLADFFNKVYIRNSSCKPSKAKVILYDKVWPKLDIKVSESNADGTRNEGTEIWFWLNDKENRTNIQSTPSKLSFTRDGDIDFLAGTDRIMIWVADLYDGLSTYGTSGIKNFRIDVSRLTNTKHQSLPSKVRIGSCSTSKNLIEFDPNGEKKEADLTGIAYMCDALKQAGRYEFVLSATDWAWNTTQATAYVNVYPNVPSASQSTLVVVKKPASGNNSSSIYADNKDAYEYTLTLKDSYTNPLYNRKIEKIEQNITGYNGGKTIFLNEVTRTWEKAFRLLISGNKTDINGTVKYKLFSYTPWEYTQRFQLDYFPWDKSYIQKTSGSQMNFVDSLNENQVFWKTFSSSFTISNGGIPLIATDQRYTFTLVNKANITPISPWKLDFIKNDSVGFSSEHEFEEFRVIDPNFSPSDLQTSFSGSVQPKTAAATLQTPVFVGNIPVSYTYQGKNIKYLLDTVTETGCNIDTLWVDIIGTLQWDGKSDITGQNKNISDISVASQRNIIRQGAYELIKGMTSGQIVNGVKYVDWDTTLSWSQSYETLIVKNGNISITGDINTQQKKFGIISLVDDAYKVETWYNQEGNIYVRNSVRNIYAFIYADGALRSAKADGSSYDDIQIRNNLYIKWALFTRNTIGWAVKSWTDFLLPGGGKTNLVEIAEKYDLNVVRKANLCIEPYSLRIEYDSKIQQDPPKGFSQ